ncbi:MAG: glycoside hydrolase family 2 [Firmicutes bacterium]|uniref:Glycoside hydrolase family 2 n=1 Tax=Candidatus Onthovivens merdipullorum TaxID=2840889 RepID=A0A9D9DI11_9BACL|nr:glycoside hydrolase family 2 [Candidatus Onthovivens merdipullorum]
MKHTLSYHKNHPNPQVFRQDYELLNGKWDFAFDEQEKGMIEGWYKDFTKARTILVPYPYQTEASGIGKNEHSDVIWYHKTITLNRLSSHLLLHFLGVDYECKLFINGKYIASHKGAYDSFNIDIAPFVKLGNNDITLMVIDRQNIDQIRGKQTWKKEPFECFYKETSGVWKDVYLEYLNEFYINTFKFYPSFAGNFVNLELFLNSFASLKNIKLNVKILFDKKEIYSNGFKINNEKSSLKLKLNKEDIHPWSTDSPSLYDVILTLYVDDEKIDEITTYFGFNEIKIKDRHVFLNDIDTYFKLILDQGYFPKTYYTGSEDEFIKDLTLIKECGFNGLRKHQKIESPLFYYYCDTLGLLLWQEMPSPHAYSFEMIKNARREILNQIDDHFNSPSIVAYVIFNESWGVNEIAKDKEESSEVTSMYHLVKDYIKDTRLLISNDGWEHTLSDILSFHNYEETYDKIFNLYKESIDLINKKDYLNVKANETKYMFAKEFKVNEDAPLMLTEFGGIAYAKDKDKGWGYGDSVKDEKEYLKKLSSLMEAIYDLKEIRGYCLTQLSDVEQEVNGLFDFNRKPKVDIKEIKKLNDKFH